jgi:hypothetical protein
MRIVAGYVLTVGAAWLEVQADTVSACTLQLPRRSRVRTHWWPLGGGWGWSSGHDADGSR